MRAALARAHLLRFLGVEEPGSLGRASRWIGGEMPGHPYASLLNV
jgi:hypothetical protein